MQLLRDGLGAVTSYLADKYAVVSGETSEGVVVMDLEQVGSFASYSRVLRYLEGLELVRHLELVSVERDTLRVLLHVDGSIERLGRALDLDRKLRPVAVVSDGIHLPEVSRYPLGSMGNPLRYHSAQ